MSFVAIDLGASSTRYVSDSGKISIAPNNMVFLNENADSFITPDPGAEDIESHLEVLITKESGNSCEHFPAKVIMGTMAEKHIAVNERPSVLTRKWTQRLNYVSVIVSTALSRLKYELPEDINLYLAVPPLEIREASDKFSELLVGSYKVNFTKYMGGTEVKVNILSVNCFEEAYMASTSFFFNMNGVPKDTNRQYLTGTVLSLDIGASTTDLAIIKNGRYLDKSGQTYQIGGNVARDTLMNAVAGRYSMDLSVEDAERTMAEGRLQQGNTYEDISDIISEAKRNLAKQLTVHMQTYFKRIGIDIKSINAVVVSGGGSMQSQYVNDDGEIVKTSEPMSYFVTQELLSWSKGTIVIPYGDDARLANVKGLYIRAKVDSFKQKQSSTQATPQPSVSNTNVQTAVPAQASTEVQTSTPVQVSTPVNNGVAEATSTDTITA